MQRIWYSDNRDLVKWSVLLHLAHEHCCAHILQIAYLRDYSFGAVEVNGIEKCIPAPVLEHFRSIRSIERAVASPKIRVFDEPLLNRERYLSHALDFVNQFSKGIRVVFLDPDTGLEAREATLKHVTNTEAAQFWGALSAGDLLALYQHQTNRNGSPWIETKQRQFAQAIGVAESAVGLGRGEKIARDVVLLFARKT